MPPTIPIPMKAEGGWTVDTGLLSQISDAIHAAESEDEALSWEQIEAVILELNRRRYLTICPPTAHPQHEAK